MVHRFWALHSTVDQDGEVGHENIVLILLYLCCLDFLTHLVKMICFFLHVILYGWNMKNNLSLDMLPLQ